MARSRRKDYSNRLRFSRTNYKASCRRENFPSPAACRTKAVNKHLGSKHKPRPASFLYFSHFNPNFVPLRIGVLTGIHIESDNLESVFSIDCNCIFIAGLVFQERSFVRRKLLPHRKLHSSAAFRRLCCAHFPKQRFKPALTYPISVTALSPFEYTGAVSELFSAISRPLRFGVVRSAADCINDSGGVL